VLAMDHSRINDDGLESSSTHKLCAGLVHKGMVVSSFLGCNLVTRSHFFVIGWPLPPIPSLTATHLLFLAEGTALVRTVHPHMGGGGGRTGLSATRHLGHAAGGHQSDLSLDLSWQTGRQLDPDLLLLRLHGPARRAIAPLRLLQDCRGPASHLASGLHCYSKPLHWLGALPLDSKHFHTLELEAGERFQGASRLTGRHPKS
uniref:Uncharacterized protein n=1 Tax=Paramormyrops kingsleyae TaxID=1676925 RepID=A0A3B3R564_9TELE